MLSQHIDTSGQQSQGKVVDLTYTTSSTSLSASTQESIEQYILPTSPDTNEGGLMYTLRKLSRLSKWQDAWDGEDALAPDQKAIERAYNWLLVLYYTISNMGLDWLNPAVSATPDGEIALEWWRGGKSLTVYFSSQASEYIRSWGLDLTKDMDDGDPTSITAIKDLWSWLLS